jgi:hypothetical protein
MLLDRLSIMDVTIWNKTGANVLRLLHKYKGRDMAMLLDLFDKEFVDEEGESLNVRKSDSAFFERIVGILPI